MLDENISIRSYSAGKLIVENIPKCNYAPDSDYHWKQLKLAYANACKDPE